MTLFKLLVPVCADVLLLQPERVNLVMTAINAALKSQRHVYPATEMRLLVLCAIAKNCRAMRVWLHVLKAEMLWGLTWLRAQPPSYYYQARCCPSLTCRCCS